MKPGYSALLHLLTILILAIGAYHSSSAETVITAQNAADDAVTTILFDYDGSNQFASYRINEDGFVDILFARDMPETLYGEILTKMQNDPNINGVLSSKSGPSCGIW